MQTRTLQSAFVGGVAVALALLVAGCGDRKAEGQDGDGGASTDGEGESEGGGDEDGSAESGELSLRVLTSLQYRSAVEDLLGSTAAAVVSPPPDIAVLGFDAVGAAQFALSTGAVRAYESSANAAAAALASDPESLNALLPCTPQSAADEACLREFVAQFGRLAWRRPLSEEEISAWTNIALDGAGTLGTFSGGVELAVAGLLQSPNFIYMVERGVADPERPGQAKLTGFEVATRLAFFLTGTTPDSELIAAAESGELDTAEGVRRYAELLLDHPRSEEALARFFDELFRLRNLPTLTKDHDLYPEFSPELAVAMREETLSFLGSVAWGGGDFRDVFDADYTFVNGELAALYGLPAPEAGFELVSLPDSNPRAGIFGHASFLALMAHPDSTSPTLRGKFIRERILCETVLKPPPDISTEIPENDPNNPQTMKERLLEHRENPACSGCHVLMDDIGLGLENFDGMGRYRETDNGLPIDAQSVFDDKGAFAGPRELGQLLRDDPRVTSCVLRNLLRAGTGHVETPALKPSLDTIHQSFANAGYDLRALLLELVASDLFRYGTIASGVDP